MAKKQQTVVEASIRENYGSGNNRRLRLAGKVPAVIYGGGGESIALTLDHNTVFHQLENESFFSQILSIETGKDTEEAVLREVQMHPVKPLIMHVDFLRIKRGVLMTMSVPLHVQGGENSPGVKEGGTVNQTYMEVEISTLPRNLPEYLIVDASALNIGDSLHLSNIILPEGVTIVELGRDDAEDYSVAAVLPPIVEAEPEEDAAEVSAEVPLVDEKASAKEDKE